MAEGLLLEQKIELAAKASGLPPEDLEAFCAEHGLELQTFTGWTTAYETGGELGLHAMLVQWKPDRETVKNWRETLKMQLKAFRPRRLRMRTEANWITVDEVKPLTSASIVHTPVFQLRAVREEGSPDRWFLYWRRAGGGWWPYARTPSFDTIEGAVAEVVTDPYSCFRLHPMR
jgi:hypothetical protein